MPKKQRTDIEQRKYYVIHNKKTVKRLNKKIIQRIKVKESRFIKDDDEDLENLKEKTDD